MLSPLTHLCRLVAHRARLSVPAALLLILSALSLVACSSPSVVAAVPAPNNLDAHLAIPENVKPTATLLVPTLVPTDSPQLALSFVSPTPTDTPTITPTPTPTNTPLPPTPTVNPTFTPTAEPPTLTPNASTRIARVPILLYHYVRPHPDRASDPLGYNLSVPPDLFEQQLAYLAGQNYTTIRLIDLVSYLRTGQPALPPKSIVLTFDDAYESAYTQVLPSLRKYGMIGTFFVPSGFVERELPGYMNWAQVKALYDAGMEIGGHTVNHADLTLKTPAQAEQEIAQARQMIEDKLGDRVQVFAYPYGHSTARIEAITARYYLASTNSNNGVVQTSDNLYQLKRITINGAWGLPEFINLFNYWLASGK